MTEHRVRFTEDQSTNLATLYGRALDAKSERPLLGDRTALDAVERIDYDFSKFKLTDDLATAVAARAKVFDDWMGEFLAANPGATVAHLGCGMDSRVYRLDPPPTVRWFDVDYPDVIELRKRIYPDRDGYNQVGSSVTDLTWLERLPADKPALIAAEGLTMYLPPADGERLLRALVGYFPGGEMMFDTYSRLGIKLRKANQVVRRAKATLRWGIDDPRELEHLGLTPVRRLQATDFYTDDIVSRLSRPYRAQLRVAGWIPVFRRMGQLLRFRF